MEWAHYIFVVVMSVLTPMSIYFLSAYDYGITPDLTCGSAANCDSAFLEYGECDNELCTSCALATIIVFFCEVKGSLTFYCLKLRWSTTKRKIIDLVLKISEIIVLLSFVASEIHSDVIGLSESQIQKKYDCECDRYYSEVKIYDTRITNMEVVGLIIVLFSSIMLVIYVIFGVLYYQQMQADNPQYHIKVILMCLLLTKILKIIKIIIMTIIFRIMMAIT